MIELHLEHTIIAFDGRVIEAFPQGRAAERYHVANVGTAEVTGDSKGRHRLQILMVGGGGFATAPLTPEVTLQAQALVGEIQKARSTL